MSKPEKIETETDLRQMAQHEWEHEIGEDARYQWGDKDAYIRNRVVVLAPRYRVQLSQRDVSNVEATERQDDTHPPLGPSGGAA